MSARRDRNRGREIKLCVKGGLGSLINTSYQHFLWHTPVQGVAHMAKRWLQDVQHLAGGAQCR